MHVDIFVYACICMWIILFMFVDDFMHVDIFVYFMFVDYFRLIAMVAGLYCKADAHG